MPEWRFTAYDLRTQAKLTDLNVAAWASTDVLEDSGDFSATIELDGATTSTVTVVAALPLTDDDGEVLTDDDGEALLADPEPTTFQTARRTVVADSTRRGRSVIVAERDGVPAFTGIIWRRQYDARSRTLKVAGRGLRSYFDHFSQTTALTYAGVDQFAILKGLVDFVQNQAGANIGVEIPAAASGVLRDRVYESFSGKYVGELMRELSNVVDGFDYDIRTEYEAGLAARRLRRFYPRRGRTFEATGLRFRAPGNAVLFDMSEDASNMATVVTALGAGDGADMLVTTAAQTSLVNAGWPAYSVTRAHKDVTNLNTLAGHAGAAAARLSGVDDESFSVQVDPTFPGQPWGSWDLGDDCQLIVDDDPLFPAGDDGSPGLVSNRRVAAHSWSVQGSSEQLTVTLDRKVIP